MSAGGLTEGPRGNFIYFDNLVMILAIFANCVVFFAVIQRKFSPTGYRLFLINLAACDLFVCTVNIVTMIYQLSSTITGVRDHPYFKCGANVLRTLQLAALFANLLNLCGMSVDHFFGVMYPIQYRNIMNERVASAAIGCIWIISFTMAFLEIPMTLVLYNESVSSSSSRSTANQIDNYAKGSTGNGKMLSSSDNILKVLFSGDNGTSGDYPPDLLNNLDQAAKPQHLLDDFFSAINSYDPNASRPKNSSSASNAINDKNTLLNQTLSLLKNNNGDDEVGSSAHKQNNVCTFFSVKKFWFEMCVIGLVAVCFLMLIICYGFIFRRVRSVSSVLCRRNAVVGRMADMSGRRTRKLILTTIIFLTAFIICWIPFVVFEFSMFIIAPKPGHSKDFSKSDTDIATLFFVQKVLYSLLIMYPLLDPIIYATRVPAVQQFLLLHVTKFFPCCHFKLQMLANGQNDEPRTSKALLSGYNNNNSENVHLTDVQQRTSATTLAPPRLSSLLEN